MTARSMGGMLLLSQKVAETTCNESISNAYTTEVLLA